MGREIESRRFKKIKQMQCCSGPNPATSSYNASVVKIYNVTTSMARF
jgi:hypothetical protein